MTYYNLSQYDKAIPELEKFLELDRKLGKEFMKISFNYVLLGKAYHKTGQYKKEKKLWKTADHYIPDDPSILQGHAILSFAEKDSSEANRYIKRFISVMKGNSATEADIAEGLGHIYYESGMLDEFKGCYRKAISSDPGNLVKLINYAVFLYRSNQNPDEFIEVIDEAIGLAQNKYDFCNYLDTKGFGLHKYGRHKEALVILEKAWDEASYKIYFIKSHLEEVRKAVAENI